MIIHATNDERDINKQYAADYPLLGDAKSVLRQFIEAAKICYGEVKKRDADGAVAAEIKKRQRRMDQGMAAQTYLQ